MSGVLPQSHALPFYLARCAATSARAFMQCQHPMRRPRRPQQQHHVCTLTLSTYPFTPTFSLESLLSRFAVLYARPQGAAPRIGLEHNVYHLHCIHGDGARTGLPPRYTSVLPTVVQLYLGLTTARGLADDSKQAVLHQHRSSSPFPLPPCRHTVPPATHGHIAPSASRRHHLAQRQCHIGACTSCWASARVAWEKRECGGQIHPLMERGVVAIGHSDLATGDMKLACLGTVASRAP
ncbi:hypothetical protein B0H19DRAFT_1254003 [Mycena capillaripes]|nr:hypothetical protein B0H19DRAFT_1254003 [Mycena capillaripes]